MANQMKKTIRKNLEIIIVSGLILLFALFYLWDSIVITIFPGHAGVYFRRIFNKGTVTERHYEEGLHLILPWNDMYIYDVRIQELQQTVDVLSQNGLTIKVVISVRYYLLKDQVPLLHQKVGENYREKVIIPSTISSVREVIGKYLPEELYTTARHVIQDEILVEAVEETGRLPIIYGDMIIERIQLPDMINAAIEKKLKRQQEFLEYKYTILAAQEERKRKVIEASGIRQYQEIIDRSLSDRLLTWQGIEATKKIAESQNAKIIVIGGKDGLPVILNTGDGPAQGQASHRDQPVALEQKAVPAEQKPLPAAPKAGTVEQKTGAAEPTAVPLTGAALRKSLFGTEEEILSGRMGQIPTDSEILKSLTPEKINELYRKAAKE